VVRLTGTCAMCGKTRGFVERVTYLDAPEAGVLVHPVCVDSFYMKIDGLLTKVPIIYVEWAERWGRHFVMYDLTEFDRRRASNNAENDPVLQWFAKMAEVLFWLLHGLEPTQDAVIWEHLGPYAPRPHFDAIIGIRKIRIDVKQADFNDRYLIWPKNKVKELKDREVDVLAMVKLGQLPDGVWGYFRGWITKDDFIKKMQIADERDIGYGLDEGTPCVDQKELSDPRLLLEYCAKV
jgi:hypothetical protein